MEGIVSAPAPSEVTFSLPLVIESRRARPGQTARHPFEPPIALAELAQAYARAQGRRQYAPGHGEGDFEILRWLGEGPHGVVYRARQLALNRPIALKVFDGEVAGTVAAALPEHEHIIRVYAEAFDPRRRLRFLSMQYVAGLSLAQLTRELGDRRLLSGAELLAVIEDAVEAPLVFNPSFARERARLGACRFDEALARIGGRLADALDFAHRHGIAHRNLKAENILIDGYGRPYLTDFAPRLGEQPLALGGVTWAVEPDRVDEQRAREEFDREEGRGDVRRLWELLSEFYGAHASPAVYRRRRSALPPLRLRDAVPHGPASARQWRESLESFEAIRKLEAELPPLGFWMRLAVRWPLSSLVLVRQVPHLAGTATCAAYCTLRPGLTLTLAQRAVMQHVLHVYSSISYPTGILLVIWLAIGLTRRFRARGVSRDEAQAFAPSVICGGEPDRTLTELRQRALRLPWRLAMVNTATWLPSIGVFTAIAYRLTGHFNPSGFTHFALAVTIAYLISTAYSTLYVWFFSVQVLYPRLLEPCPDLRARAARELRGARAALRWLPLVMAAIPLTGAFLLVQDGPGNLQPDRLRLIQGFLLTLIVVGAGGFVFTLAAVQRLFATIRALGGR